MIINNRSTKEEIQEYRDYIIENLNESKTFYYKKERPFEEKDFFLGEFDWSSEGFTLKFVQLEREGCDYDQAVLIYHHVESDLYLRWEGYYSSYEGFSFETTYFENF